MSLHGLLLVVAQIAMLCTGARDTVWVPYAHPPYCYCQQQTPQATTQQQQQQQSASPLLSSNPSTTTHPISETLQPPTAEASNTSTTWPASQQGRPTLSGGNVGGRVAGKQFPCTALLDIFDFNDLSRFNSHACTDYKELG